MDTFGQLPPEHAAILRAVLDKRAPDLASALQDTAEPSLPQRREVEDAIADELMDEVEPPTWAPTSYGWSLENLMDAFLNRFPISPGPSAERTNTTVEPGT